VISMTTSPVHLDSPPPALASTAAWNGGDPPFDIDGDPRPAVSGAMDYAGADVPR